ncbi:MAG: hypothetical protein OEU95_08340, partial [Nitrospirota bacterium]|nr:hypothetical protein [Nitrospirota bacterium]
MKVPFVREWGSWVVFVSSWLAAIAAGSSSRHWQAGADIIPQTALTIIGLTLLVNSKNPLASAIRTKGRNREHLLWLLFFVLAGLAFLIPFIIAGMERFSVFSLLVLSYVVLLKSGKEHHLLAELNGFALLTLPAPVVYFMITGVLSLKLYAAVLVFFAAGVFKVKLRIKKSAAYRMVMALYCCAAVIIFYVLNIPVILLL